MRLTKALRHEYARLFETCVIRVERLDDVACVAAAIVRNRKRYELVSKPLGVPWYVTGIIHSLEASLRFDRHLHNGDPLTNRTQNHPAGRPEEFRPPFVWEHSAFDALVYARLYEWTDWLVPGTLYRLEMYNGFGYRVHHPEVLSPYLWSFSNHYTCGKYIVDGRFSEVAVSEQCGGAVLLKRLIDIGVADRVSGKPSKRFGGC